MIKPQLIKLFSLIACTGMLSGPAWAQSAQDTAKNLGQRGVYGKDSLDPENAETAENTTSTPQESPEEIQARQERIKAKYPLSTTGRTPLNQTAHTHLLKGIQLYNQTKKIFEAANEIASTYDQEKHTLEIKQKGIIQSRLAMKDLILYGNEYAHIALKIRALQEAEKTINSAISNFSQAQSISPSISVIGKWLRIGQDTRKAIRFHIRFYQISLKAVERGVTAEQLERMAMVWKTPSLKPEDSLTTRIYTHGLDYLREKNHPEDADKEVIQLDGFKDKLPDLEFKVDKF